MHCQWESLTYACDRNAHEIECGARVLGNWYQIKCWIYKFTGKIGLTQDARQMYLKSLFMPLPTGMLLPPLANKLQFENCTREAICVGVGVRVMWTQCVFALWNLICAQYTLCTFVYYRLCMVLCGSLVTFHNSNHGESLSTLTLSTYWPFSPLPPAPNKLHTSLYSWIIL